MWRNISRFADISLHLTQDWKKNENRAHHGYAALLAFNHRKGAVPGKPVLTKRPKVTELWEADGNTAPAVREAETDVHVCPSAVHAASGALKVLYVFDQGWSTGF